MARGSIIAQDDLSPPPFMFDDEEFPLDGLDSVLASEDAPELEEPELDIPFGPANGLGAITGDATGEDSEVDDETHYENLAELIEEGELNLIADDLLDMMRADEESEEPWRKQLEDGLYIAGFVKGGNESLPFPGASNVVHPMIIEAIVQFNARAYQELMPPTGPCKGMVVGEETDEKREQAKRGEDHMNFQMTEEDEGYSDEIDQLLFYLPMAGSAFTKTYFDFQLNITTTRFVRAEEIVMPYTAVSINNTPRYAHRQQIFKNEMRRRMDSGLYRDIELVEPAEFQGGSNAEAVFTLYDEAEGKEPVLAEDDDRYLVYDVCIDYDLPGFEDRDEKGNPTGIGLPYIITVEENSRRILAIRRNWRKNDPLQRKRSYFTHYKYLPGLGSKGSGLCHHIGGLAEASSGSVRAILDAAAFATLQGGFKSKEARLPAGQITFQPGQWLDVDLSADELNSAFFTPPFKEPSNALFEMLKIMEENARRFAGTTEAVVGDASSSGPVGTTVALIEQGTKVMSGIHRRLHRAQANEFKIRAEVNAEHLPEGVIYYDCAGGHKYVTSDDYSNREVNFVPVSDPNIVSAQQRIAINQGMIELMTQTPGDFKRHEVLKRTLEDMGVGDTKRYLVDPDARYRFDPASESARIMASKPIHAFHDQNHDGHLGVHMAQMEYLKTLPPEQGQPLIMALLEHMAKHEGYRIYQMVNQLAVQSGQPPLPPLDLYSDDPENQMPPELENQVTAQVSQFVQALVAQIQANQPPPPEDAMAKADIDRKNAAAAEDEKRKQLQFQADEQRKQDAFTAEQLRAETKHKNEQLKADELAAKQKPEQDANAEHERQARTRELDQKDRELDIRDRESQAKSEQDAAKLLADNPDALAPLKALREKSEQGTAAIAQQLQALIEEGQRRDEQHSQALEQMQQQSNQQMQMFMTAMQQMMQGFTESLKQMNKKEPAPAAKPDNSGAIAQALADVAAGQQAIADALSKPKPMPAISFVERDGMVVGAVPVKPNSLDQITE